AGTVSRLNVAELECTIVVEVVQASLRNGGHLRAEGHHDELRDEQVVDWMWTEMREHLLDALRRDEKVAARLEEVEAAVRAGRLSPTTAAHELLAAHGLAGAPEV